MNNAPLQLDVVFDTADFVVINKPMGVSMHQQTGHVSVTEFIKPLALGPVFVVHRLDTETSGLLVIAKHKQAASALGKMLQQRQVEKRYVALSAEKPKKKQGHILGDMQPSRSGNYKLTQGKVNPAYTQFFSYALKVKEQALRLFVLKPHTGKTHQLRVALKSISSPILGDSRYGKATSDRMYLHAHQLRFEWQGATMQFECLPKQGDYFLDKAFVEQAALFIEDANNHWPQPIWRHRV